MKFKVTKTALLEALQAVQNVVGVRSTLPILSNVLVQAEKDRLSLTTTDLDMSVSCTLEADVLKTGITTMPVRRLSGIVRELPESAIEVEVDDKNTASVKCESSFFKIIGLSEEEFPRTARAESKASYTLDQGVFREMLKKTAYAASADETRLVLNGVLLSFKAGKLTMVATDGRRLALIEREVEFPKEAEVDLILPIKVITELIHTLGNEGPLKLHAMPNQVVLEYGAVQVTSKLVEGTYPNYRQVIPAQCEERITVDREELLTSLRRVSLLATDRSIATKLVFGKNKLTISMDSPEVGEARETLPIKYAGKEITVAFNPEFMMDPLKNLTNDEVALELTDEMSPGVIKCDIPFLYVLMPMRVS